MSIGSESYISLQEAVEYCDYSQEYLSLRARQGKLKAVKFGRNWMTKEEWLKEYLEKIESYNNYINNGVSVETVKTNLFKNFHLRTIRPAFALGLVFVLFAANIALGKENLKNAFDSGKTIVAFGKEGTEIVFSDITKETSAFVIYVLRAAQKLLACIALAVLVMVGLV